MKSIQVAIALIFNPATSQLLITRRKSDTVLANYWEFPGGKCLAGEMPERCAIRETLEETNLHIDVLRPLATIEHTYPHAHIHLYPFVCQLANPETAELKLLAIAEAKWIDPADLKNYTFPEANAPLLTQAAQGWRNFFQD